MKMRIILMAALCLLMGTVLAVSAQEKTAPSFAGDWELDTGRSNLSERVRIEAMTMRVTQTETQLTVERTVKMGERPAGVAGGGGGGGRGMGGGGRGMGGGMAGGDGTTTYTLDGKETSATAPGGMGEMKVKAELEKSGKLKIVQTREFETQMGAMSIKTTETWELLENGQTLKVVRDMETPRGTQTSEMYFTKK